MMIIGENLDITKHGEYIVLKTDESIYQITKDGEFLDFKNPVMNDLSICNGYFYRKIDQGIEIFKNLSSESETITIKFPISDAKILGLHNCEDFLYYLIFDEEKNYILGELGAGILKKLKM
ncbi:hypothetical protein EDEG_00234 [Edhazardia aedis USNM 41457]|uniref:Uncharacterized protein n=1 Tax=Edhazardia aedis (strain USNM 41457) TaxID=1003232 RepID=J9D6V6_EDHAE|nr:hypothetical protein EDEG_00234 [Edhazardia aedis USNM 41457]|eukprot:EJW03254.1 hypothetical protein EDEG_00234 [Edhazardia aedis USNM 41457]